MNDEPIAMQVYSAEQLHERHHRAHLQLVSSTCATTLTLAALAWLYHLQWITLPWLIAAALISAAWMTQRLLKHRFTRIENTDVVKKLLTMIKASGHHEVMQAAQLVLKMQGCLTTGQCFALYLRVKTLK